MPFACWLVLSVVSDSYMGIFLPSDIKNRIQSFIYKELDFPFIKKNELMGIFYIFGKDNGVKGELDRLIVMDLIKRSISQITQDVRAFYHDANKSNSDYVRENYTRRILQISIEIQHSNLDKKYVNDRMYFDPTLLSYCFVHHISYYRQDFFFESFQPFKRYQLPPILMNKLEERMLLVGYNVKDKSTLPYRSTLEPFFKWLKHN
jgi:hypothetical protein